MKKKELLYLALAAAIFLVAGYVAYTQLGPSNGKPKTVEVEKIGPIPDKLSETGLARLNDPEQVQDFSSPVDLTGLGNTSIFGN